MIDPILSWAISWTLQSIGACCAILWFIIALLEFFGYFRNSSGRISKEGQISLKRILISFSSIFILVVLLSVLSINIGSYSPIGGLYGVPILSIVLVIVGFILILYSRISDNRNK